MGRVYHLIILIILLTSQVRNITKICIVHLRNVKMPKCPVRDIVKRGKSMAAPTKRPPAVHLHRSQEVSSSLLSPSCYLLPPGNRDMVGKRSNFAHVITFRQLIERGKATPLQLVGKNSVRKNIPNLCHVEICFMLPYEKV